MPFWFDLDKDKDGVITLEEWVQLGKEAGLVKELLGPQFMSIMQDFDPDHAEQTRKKSIKKKKSIGK